MSPYDEPYWWIKAGKAPAHRHASQPDVCNLPDLPRRKTAGAAPEWLFMLMLVIALLAGAAVAWVLVSWGLQGLNDLGQTLQGFAR